MPGVSAGAPLAAMNCNVCGDSGAKRCTNCYSVAYCSTGCQKEDWNSHKKVCKKLNRPQPQQVLKEWRHVPDVVAEYSTSIYFWDEHHTATLIERMKTVGRSTIDLSDQEILDLINDQVDHWSNAVDADGQRIIGDKIGDFIDFTPFKADRDTAWKQIFRHCVSFPQVYEFGHTYVGLGYVDLWQLMDGTYLNVDKANLKFYGFDGSELAVARSLVILEMMKASFGEISSKTILQVWFSSCLDAQTKTQFTSFLQKHLSCHSSVNNPLLKKYAKIWLKRLPHMSTEDAKFDFHMDCDVEDFFHPLLNLKREGDRLKFMRYLMTGCLFVEEVKAVCGNPTILPCETTDDKWLQDPEPAFAFINLSSIDLNTESLIGSILNYIKYKLMSFRILVQNEKVQCFLEVKFVKPDDTAFAKRLQELKPYGIDWGDLPDYMRRLDFLDFAEKCSGPDTLHFFHSMDWTRHVFGASWTDLLTVERRSPNFSVESTATVLQQYQNIVDALLDRQKKSIEPWVLKNAENAAPLALKVPLLENPSIAANRHLSLKYAEKYFNFFLTDRKGQPINRQFAHMQEHAMAFTPCTHTIFGYFTFNKDIKIQDGRH